MSSETSFLDPSLLDLFKQEVETHSTSLYNNLLAWEKDPSNPSKIEPLMRSAHSLKGASKIIGLQFYTNLAHLLEDCFVASQNKKLLITPSLYDSFLKTVDLLSDVQSLSISTIKSWPNPSQKPLYDQLINDLQSSLNNPSQSPPIPSHPSSSSSAINKLFFSELSKSSSALKDFFDSLINQKNISKDLLQNAINHASSIKNTSTIADSPDIGKLALNLENTLLDIQKNGLSQDSLKRCHSILTDIISTTKRKQRALKSENPSPRSFIVSQNTPPPISPSITPILTPPSTPLSNHQIEAESSTQDSSSNDIKISAKSLDKFISISAEFIVESKKLDFIKKNTLKLKNLYYDLLKQTEHYQFLLEKHYLPQKFTPLITKVSDNSKNFRNLTQEYLDQIDDYIKNNYFLSSQLYSEVLSSRMRPLKEGFQALPRLVRNIARSLNKNISLDIHGQETPIDRDILQKLEAPLNHIIRNACDHGIEFPQDRINKGKNNSGLISINAYHNCGMLILTISDDGNGIDIELIRSKILKKGLLTQDIASTLSREEILEFLFLPGFSTKENVTEISGRGVGLDVVKTIIQEIGGKIKIESILGQGTTFHLQLPITRSVIRALLVIIHNELFAIPLTQIHRVLKIPPSSIFYLENKPFIQLENHNVPLLLASEVLAYNSHPTIPTSQPELPVVILQDNKSFFGIIVDKLKDETQVAVRPLNKHLNKIPCISSASINEEGIPILILDVDDLAKTINRNLAASSTTNTNPLQLRNTSPKSTPSKTILIVDDSPTVRETERIILHKAGFNVLLAQDGVDGWNTLCSNNVDLIVSDIDMPRMNGFELIQNIRNHPNYKKIPIIIVSYKDRPEDHQKGLDVHANYYLTKSSFKDDTFLNVVNQLCSNS